MGSYMAAGGVDGEVNRRGLRPGRGTAATIMVDERLESMVDARLELVISNKNTFTSEWALANNIFLYFLVDGSAQKRWLSASQPIQHCRLEVGCILVQLRLRRQRRVHNHECAALPPDL